MNSVDRFIIGCWNWQEKLFGVHEQVAETRPAEPLKPRGAIDLPESREAVFSTPYDQHLREFEAQFAELTKKGVDPEAEGFYRIYLANRRSGMHFSAIRAPLITAVSLQRRANLRLLRRVVSIAGRRRKAG